MFAENYDFINEVEKHYGINIEYTFPEASEVSELLQKKGLFSFYQDGHQECCGVRKVKPLKQKLSTLSAWITGVRKDQSVTRTAVDTVGLDGNFEGKSSSLIKWNPLANVTKDEVWQAIKENKVPHNKLHDQGFVSIGCQPCTRPIKEGQHEREGRWWWENAETKECGLHASK